MKNWLVDKALVGEELVGEELVGGVLVGWLNIVVRLMLLLLL